MGPGSKYEGGKQRNLLKMLSFTQKTDIIDTASCSHQLNQTLTGREAGGKHPAPIRKQDSSPRILEEPSKFPYKHGNSFTLLALHL